MLKLLSQKWFSSFKQVASIAAQLENTPKSKLKQELIEGQDDDFYKFLIGAKVMKIYQPQLISQICIAYNISGDNLMKNLNATQDLADTVYFFHKEQPSQLETQDVLLELSYQSPDLVKLLKMCGSKDEAKFLIRHILGTMRIGVAKGLISKILPADRIQKIFNIQRENYVVGIPIESTLAKSYTSSKDLYDEFLKDVEQPLYMEYKYDGERIQLHFDGNEIHLFSRSLEDQKDKFQILAQNLKDYLTSQNIQGVFDCELICYKNGRILPFQDSRNESIFSHDEVSLVCFDTLIQGKQPIMDLPKSKRHIPFPQITKNNRIVISKVESIKIESEEQIEKYYQQSLSDGLEGLMIKIDTDYKPGARTDWAKLKEERECDLVVCGAMLGQGKRKHLFGSYLLGLWHEGTLYSITKLGTGLNEKNLIKFTQQFEKLTLDEQPEYLESLVKPDVWIDPIHIWQVKYDTITMSNAYYIKEYGLSLRFPRFVRERPDKKTTEDPKQLIEMYKKKFIF